MDGPFGRAPKKTTFVLGSCQERNALWCRQKIAWNRNQKKAESLNLRYCGKKIQSGKKTYLATIVQDD